MKNIPGSTMCRTTRFAVMVLLAAGLMSCAPHAGDAARAAYEVQERCGRITREWFNVFWGPKTQNNLSVFSYQNHYNAKLNRCFARILQPDANGATYWLFDVNENRSLGDVTTSGTELIHCDVNGKKCAGVKEWEAEVASTYMER
jgi:hypothetical protein